MAKLMGILNVTPDSFFDKGRYFTCAIERGMQMIAEGADILDIGGESTRPGAEQIPEDEELKRVIPIIRELRRATNLPISIDTMKPKVAAAAIQAGANMINDVTGFRHPDMVSLAAETDAEICVMHMQGTPQNMQKNPQYENGVVNEIIHWLNIQIEHLIKKGIKKEKIIIDPGIGFGKSVADNVEIIHNLPKFKAVGLPVLLGVSRKSFLQNMTGKSTEDLLPATLGINAIALLSQTDIIRVHDVKEHRTLIDLMQSYLK